MANDLKIKIKVDSNTGELVVTKNKFNKLGKAIDTTKNQADKFVKRFSQMAHIGASIYAVNKSFDVLISTIKTLTTTSMEFEKFETVLKTIEGSSSKAKKSMAWVEEFASKTPYQLKQVTDSFVKLKAYGINPIDGTLKTLGNTASAMGKDINQAVEAMANAVTGENERLKEFGIKAAKQGNQIAYSWADSSGKAKHIIIENNREIIQSTLESIFNSKYTGAMEEQSKTLNGMLSNMQDNYTKFQKNIMDGGLHNYFKALATEINKRFLDSFEKTTNAGKVWANKFIDFINEVINGVGFLVDAITVIRVVLNTIELGFKYLVKGIVEAFNVANNAGNAAIEKYNQFVSLFGGEKVDLIPLKDVSVVNESIEESKNKITELVSSLETGRKFAKNFTDDVNKAFSSINDISLYNFKELAGDGAKQIIQEVINAIDGNFKSFKGDKFVDLYPIPDFSWIKEMNAEIAKEKQSIDSLLKEATDLITSDTDKINAKYLEMYNVVQGVFDDEKMKSFFDKWIESLEDINKESSKYEGIGSKDWTSGLSGQVKDIANIGNAFADLAKEQEQWDKYSEENAINEEDTNTHLQNQIGLYGNIAGAVVSMSEEGSAAAKVAQVAQTALAVAQGVTAILNQGQGDPYTAIARMVAMAAMVASTLSSLSGAGGASISSPYSASEAANMAITEMEDQGVVDRLDQQIALLEAIERNGSAAALSVDLAKAEFNQAQNKWMQEVFEDSRLGWVKAMFDESGSEWKHIKSYYEELGTVNPYEMSGDSIRINTAMLRNNMDDFIQIIADMSQMVKGDPYSYTGPFGQSLAKELGWGEGAHEAFLAKVREGFVELQGYVNDWAIGIVDSISELEDASDTLKEAFDSITGTARYASEELTQAFEDFGRISGGDYSGYIEDNIENMVAAQNFIDSLSGITFEGNELTNLELLLSKVPELIDEQIDKVTEFSELTGATFAGGAEEALNYIDAIELVADAMETSRNNITSFVNSFKTDTQITQSLFLDSGVKLAQNYEELQELLNTMASDTFGLTDEDLEMLEANKAYLDELTQQQEDAQKEMLQSQVDSLNAQKTAMSESLSSITSDISSLNSILSSLGNIIDKLKGATIGSTYSLQNYYNNMRETLELSASSDYEDYKSSLQSTITASSALFDSSNFSSQYDQKFAQAVSLNQFEGMEIQAETQIDYLRQIEENTRNQLAVLSSQISDASSAISNYQASTPTIVINMPEEVEEQETASSKLVSKAFKDLYGIEVDTSLSGFKYWVDELDNNPSITENNLHGSIARGADDYGQIGSTTHNGAYIADATDKYINSLYLSIIGRSAEQAGLDFWSNAFDNGVFNNSNIVEAITQGAYNSGWTPQTKDEWIKRNGFVPFADGGIVTGPVNALIGEAGYNEAVIPLKDSNDPLQTKELVKEIKELKNQVKDLVTINEFQAKRLDRIDKRDSLAQRTAS